MSFVAPLTCLLQVVAIDGHGRDEPKWMTDMRYRIVINRAIESVRVKFAERLEALPTI